MSLIRPEMQAQLSRWREMIYAAVIVALGLWLMRLGGLLLIPVGIATVALGLGWGITALRRIRFSQDVLAPGMVEVDEGQVGYLGPTFGGFVALPDLVELRLLTLNGRRLWRLKQADGQALLIPIDAAGADRLYDVFAGLSGFDMARAVAALEAPAIRGGNAVSLAQDSRLIWVRPSHTGQDALQPLDDVSRGPRGRS